MKMAISGSERQAVLDICNKMAHARSEEQVQYLYTKLQDLGHQKVTDYFAQQWWGIRSQWVVGLMDSTFTALTHTNNRVECFSQKTKRVVNKHR